MHPDSRALKILASIISEGIWRDCIAATPNERPAGETTGQKGRTLNENHTLRLPRTQ